MANEKLQGLIEEFDKRRAKRANIKRIGGIVAICAALVVSCALVVPAVTATYSDMEDINGDGDSVLVCGKQEHTHDESCATQTVSCELPEGNVHVHVPACYNSKGKLICGNEVAGHVHLDSCYDKNGKLICKLAETAHIHTDACYDKNGKLICESKLPHIHGITCYEKTEVTKKVADTNAAEDKSSSSDAEQSSSAKASTKEVTVTEYKLTCNEKSYGHIHTDACLNEEGDVDCGQAEAATVPHKHSEEAGCYTEEITCGLEEHEHTDACYKKVEGSSSSDADSSSSSDAATSDGDGSSEGDGTVGAAEPDLTDQEIKAAEDQGLLYENKSMIVAFDVPEQYKDSIKLNVTEVDEIPQAQEVQDNTVSADQPQESAADSAGAAANEGSADEGATNEGAQAASQPEEGQEQSTGTEESQQDLGEQVALQPVGDAVATAEEEEPAYQVNLHIDATLDGQPVENIADLGITAKLQMKSNVIKPILKEIDFDEVADEIKDEVGAEIKVIQYEESTDNSFVEEKVDEVVVTKAKDAATTFGVTANTFTARAGSTPDPNFTVFYKSNVKVPVLGDSGTLDIIDTKEKNLPENGKDPSTKKLTLNSDGTVKTSDQEVDIYSSKTFNYHASPSIDHFNKVYRNSNYRLSKIRVEHNGVTNEYEYDQTIHFTNRPESAGEHNGAKYILINNGAAITLVFDPKTDNQDFDTAFYDYDISDGFIYSNLASNGDLSGKSNTSAQGDGKWYANTNKQGINSDGNYSSSGTRLGFGNVNTGTGLGAVSWGSNQLNKYNNNGFKGCTFGLVDKLEDGKIVYKSGVSAPKLFDDGNATGKTTYTDSSLVFDQSGDTYTLSSASVAGSTVSGLNKFSHPGNYNNIWTNNFWPLDSQGGTDGHDMIFGGPVLGNRCFSGVTEPNNDSPTGNFPPSDDGKDHNSYFGMQYKVKFSLTEDYVGPLNYIFFGDDDLWVFLDNQLVLDIGGVHSSVGQYVDLWDYLDQGSSGEHTLSIYYTERGASGSTCYMNFTLPSVSSSTIEQDTGELRVSKEVKASQDSPDLKPELLNREFEFTINLSSDKEGENKLFDDYSYTRYSSTGEVIESDLIVWDGGSFKLKNGEYIIIKYLPVGAYYKIQEVLDKDNDPYLTSYEYYPGTSSPETSDFSSILGVPPKAFEGNIESNTVNYELKYINTVPYELPDTGGQGNGLYLYAGIAMMLFAGGIVLCVRSRKQETE